jgi:hypothetical protein
MKIWNLYLALRARFLVTVFWNSGLNSNLEYGIENKKKNRDCAGPNLSLVGPSPFLFLFTPRLAWLWALTGGARWPAPQGVPVRYVLLTCGASSPVAPCGTTVWDCIGRLVFLAGVHRAELQQNHYGTAGNLGSVRLDARGLCPFGFRISRLYMWPVAPGSFHRQIRKSPSAGRGRRPLAWSRAFIGDWWPGSSRGT